MPFSAPIYIFNSGYFNPGTLNLRGWWRSNFVPNVWTGDPGGTIPIQIVEGATPPTAGAAVNGYAPADFDGVNDLLTYSDHFLDAMLSSSQYYFAAVVRPRNPVVDGGGITNPIIFADDNLNVGVSFSDAGMSAFQYDDTTPGWNEIDVACSASNWHFVQVWHDGTNLNLQVDTTVGTPIATDMNWLNTYITGMIPKWGTSTNLAFYDGEILAFISSQSGLTTAERDGLGAFFQDRYGLSFGITAPSVNPNRVTLTSFFENYAGSPWIGTQNSGMFPVGATPPTTGSAVGTRIPANFNGTDDYLQSSYLMQSYANNNAGSGWVLFNADTANTIDAPGLRVQDPGILIQGGGGVTWSITYSNNGVCHLLYDGAYKEIVAYAGIGEWHLAQFKWDGSFIYLRIDKGEWFSFGAGNCDTTAAGGYLRLGADYANATFFDGRIADVGITDSVLTDADFDKVCNYIQGRYSVNLTVPWEPSSLALTGWWRPNFTVAPWVSSPSIGISNGYTLDATASDPTAGTAVNGFIPFTFNGVANGLQSGIITWANLIEPILSDTGSIFILFYGRSPAAHIAQVYNNASFVMDTGGSVGVTWSLDGVTPFHYDAVAVDYIGISEPAIPLAWHLAQTRWNATTLEVRVDHGSWQTLAVDSAAQATVGALKVGGNWDGSAFVNADILEIGFNNVRMSDGDFDNILSYAEDRYNLVLGSEGFTGWWRSSFTGNPWVGQPSAGYSTGRNLIETTNPPSVGSSLNGFSVANFDGANDNMTADGNVLQYIPLGCTSFTWGLLVNSDVANDAFVIGDVDGNAMIEIHSSNFDGTGTLFVTLRVYDNIGYKTAQAVAADGWSLSAWHFIQAGLDGANYWIRIDGNTRVIGDAIDIGFTMNNGLIVGNASGAANYYNGEIAEIMVAPYNIPDARLNTIRTSLNTRYGTSI